MPTGKLSTGFSAKRNGLDTKMAQADRQKNMIDRKNVIKQMLEVIAREILNSLSRGAPSTTRPPLRCGPDMRNCFGDQAFFGDFRQNCALAILQVLAAKSGTPQERVGTNDTNLAQQVPRMFRETVRKLCGPSVDLEPVPDPSDEAIPSVGYRPADRDARERDQP